MNAVQRLIPLRAVPNHFAHHVLVTMNAGVVQDAGVARANADGFRIVLQSKGGGMPEAVLRLDEVLGNGGMRRVTVIARRDRMMAGFLPAVILLAHNVAIDARR